MEVAIGSLFTLESLFTLMMLVLLQAVLGFDNLLYISIESKGVAPERQAYVRRIGIGIAILLRIVLLFVTLSAIDYLQDILFDINLPGITSGQFSGHAIIVLLGGVFIIYTAIKEITHMLVISDLESEGSGATKSVASAILMIVIMNLVFSFDSILSSIALTDNFWIMAIAIVITGFLMIVLADTVSEFLQKNRTYEILGLFILLIVGILLLSEGGELAHLEFFGHKVEAMQKSTFYFVLVVMVLVDVVQSRFKKKLLLEEARRKALA